jgi:alpha-amylase/alpha-mannosidase (GH57 family)
MKEVTVAFVWHFHQPYYTDPLTYTAPFPWVRLHAAKGYFDMGVLLEEHPDMRATVNLTPSLLLQIQEQVRGTVSDVFWAHTTRPASDLNEDERTFVLRHFFAANWNTMVRPYDRYYTLLIQRGTEPQESDLVRLARRFSVQDFLDLQVWQNLAWFGHRAVARYPALRELIAKGRHFTEADKQEVLKIQHEVLSALIPLFHRLYERGQIELSTTPFFHPILPLLIDSDIAKRSRPDSALPPRFVHPEDARAQLRLALEFHENLFGHRPAGIWPSEGSVCPELVSMLAELGICWTATDEGILAASTDTWRRDEQLYRPYLLTGEQGGEVAFLFRDRELSDAIGFTYSRNDPAAAVTDFCARLRLIGERSSDSRPLVAVILDGENPWEHYPDGGEGFLRGLYATVARSRGEIRLRSSTPKACLNEQRPQHRLSRLHSGSWINADLRIWVGHAEDNDAWERVAKTRRFLQREHDEGRHTDETVKAAWSELYAAEGSDWYWWYGDEFETDHKAIFDHLFRLHLANVYRLLGTPVPDFLKNPVWRRLGTEVAIREPIALISPCIDGIVTDFYEWRGAGYMDGQAPLSAMYKGPPVFSRVYFGFNFEHFWLRLDPLEEREPDTPGGDDQQHPVQREVQVLFLEPRPVRLVFALDLPDPPQFRLQESVDGSTFSPGRAYETIRRKKIIELAVPLKDLSIDLGSQIQLVIKVMEAGLERERLPQHQPLVLNVPDHTFEATMWKA